MAGGIAEAYYGIPEHIQEQGMKRLPLEMQHIVEGVKQRINDVVSD